MTGDPSSPHPPVAWRRDAVIAALLVVVTLAVFGQVLGHEFVNYDDPRYVTNNPHVQEGFTWRSVQWAFTTRYANNWHPLTWFSHILDWQLFGRNPAGHHLTNLLLHLANTLLLFAVLRRMTGAVGPSGLVAALFAVHPLHVESVAWVAERKDVLSTFFWMLTLLAYARYAERRTAGRYLLTLLLFALGLMTKPMLVTLPCVMLLLDYWPLRRLELPAGGAGSRVVRLLVEKLPFFALSAASSAVTVWAQNVGGTVMPTEVLPVPLRAANAVVACARYIQNTIWPADLAVFYPHPGVWPAWEVAAAAALVGGSTILACWLWRRRPYWIVGWLWYLGTLVPVIGLVQVGGQALADRYTYVPLIGLFLVAAWGGVELASQRRAHPAVGWAVAVVIVLACAVVSWFQTRLWRDSIALFEHAVRVTENNHVAHNNLAIALAERGRIEDATIHLLEVVRIRPRFASAHNNLGLALAAQNRTAEAAAHFARAVEINPGFAEAHNNLGCALAGLGRAELAIPHFERAISLAPSFADAHYNLAAALLERGEADRAENHLREALRLRPGYAQAAQKLSEIEARRERSEPGSDRKPDESDARPSFPEHAH
jgi:tetratricopeptide (TPR) repeat protein